MAVTISPSTEAAQAIVQRINAGETYCLPVRASYSEQLIDPLEQIGALRVDVVTESEQTLEDTLAIEDRASLDMRIWIRVKVEQFNEEDVEPLKLLTRQIFQQINNFNSSDNRVKVWECDYEQIDKPLKTALLQTGVFVSSILLRVEVETSA